MKVYLWRWDTFNWIQQSRESTVKCLERFAIMRITYDAYLVWKLSSLLRDRTATTIQRASNKAVTNTLAPRTLLTSMSTSLCGLHIRPQRSDHWRVVTRFVSWRRRNRCQLSTACRWQLNSRRRLLKTACQPRVAFRGSKGLEINGHHIWTVGRMVHNLPAATP